MTNSKIFIKSGHGIARFLRDHNVKYIFGIPDGLTLALYEGIRDTEGIEHILLNDERNAAFAADAYARITGSLGVCDAGSAGALNFPIALAEAKGSASPVLALIGTIKPKKLLRNFPHEIKVAETLRSISKWTEKILDPENLPRFMAYGIKKALSGKPGPVALVISEDVLNSSKLTQKSFNNQVSNNYLINSYRIVPEDSIVDQIVEKVINCQQPAIFTGNGAIISGSYEEIAELSTMLKAPVFSTISGKGIMANNENFEKNYYFGTIGLFGIKPNHRFLKAKVDLLIVVGNRMTEDDTAFFKYPSQNMEMIQIDVDPTEIGLNYNPLNAIGDPKATLRKILRKLKQEVRLNFNHEKRDKNISTLKQRNINYRNEDRAKWLNSEPIKPQRVLNAISKYMTGEDYLVTDASASSRWIGAYFPIKTVGRKIVTPRGVGPTGFGVGALIGTCYAAHTISKNNKKSKKILLTGDGSLMNGGINELETIAKLGLNCTIVVLNNHVLGYIKFAQTFIFNRDFYEVDRPDTDFSKIAEAFGGNGFRVEKVDKLDEVIKNAIQLEGFTIVDVVTDPEEYLPPSYYYHEWDYYGD